MIVAQAFGGAWVRGGVLSRNTLEQVGERLTICNRVAMSSVLAVPCFRGDTCVRAHTRAYMCEGKQGTREQINYIVIIDRVSCSKAVLKLFSLRTGGTVPGLSWPVRRGTHFLAGGNGCGSASRVTSGRIRGRNEGTGGDSFRVFGCAAGELGLIEGGGGNGGIPPFLQGSAGAVGRLVLEGWGQAAGSKAVSVAGRQLGRLRAVPGRIDRSPRRAAPPSPPFPRARSLSCGHARLAEFGTRFGASRPAALRLDIQADQAPARQKIAKVGTAPLGRGGERALCHAAKAATGRGGSVRVGQVGISAPGWIGDAKAGGGYVN